MNPVTCGALPAAVHTISTVRPQVFHSPAGSPRAEVDPGPPGGSVPGVNVLDRSGRSGQDWGIVLSRPRGGSAGVLALGLSALLVAFPAVVAGRQPARTPDAASAAPAVPWFRLFLLDGQILSTLGEFTRVDDVVLLQVPVGAPGAGGVPDARTVTIAASAVDWTRTDAYREALRRVQFEQAGGARAYAIFTEEVAATLRDVALLPDPLERIRRLEAARVQLAQWPATHHGYRAEDVAATLSVVDDLLNGMRAATGQQAFSIALTAAVATPAVAPATSLLPPPIVAGHDRAGARTRPTSDRRRGARAAPAVGRGPARVGARPRSPMGADDARADPPSDQAGSAASRASMRGCGSGCWTGPRGCWPRRTCEG